MGNVIVGIIVIAAVGLAAAGVIKNRKSGGCAHCSNGCSCKKKKNG